MDWLDFAGPAFEKAKAIDSEIEILHRRIASVKATSRLSISNRIKAFKIAVKKEAKAFEKEEVRRLRREIEIKKRAKEELKKVLAVNIMEIAKSPDENATFPDLDGPYGLLAGRQTK